MGSWDESPKIMVGNYANGRSHSDMYDLENGLNQEVCCRRKRASLLLEKLSRTKLLNPSRERAVAAQASRLSRGGRLGPRRIPGL